LLSITSSLSSSVIGYGGHVHEPSQALVNGEFSFVGNIVGRYDLGEINAVAERIERRDIDDRAVITP